MRTKLATLVCISLVSMSALSACSASDPREDLAAQLAAGLTALDLSKVQFANASGDAATANLKRAFSKLDEIHPEITAGKITEDGSNKASAVLNVTWKFKGQPEWKYSTKAEFVESGDTWKVNWNPNMIEPTLKENLLFLKESTTPQRAGILSGSGEEIVVNRPVVHIGIDKTWAEGQDLTDSANSLAAILEIDPVGYLAKVNAAGPKAFVEAITLREADHAAIESNLSIIPGVREIKDTIPLAPTRTFARAILGAVGEATAEIVEKSEGKIAAGEQTGLSGIQAQYNDQLRGSDGFTISVGDETNPPQVVYTQPTKDGTAIKTTLDIPTQSLAESLLEPVEPASAIVAIRPSTGEILAAASGPGSKGQSTATSGHYAPGSTFKVISTLGMLRAGLTPDSIVPCTPTNNVDGRQFKNFPDYPATALGDIPLRTAFANSCNTAFISQRDKVSQADLEKAAQSLGVATKVDLGIPSFFGSVPSDGEGTDHAASMIGQARVEMSPIAMATVAASVAQSQTVRPVFLPELAAAKESSAPPLTAAEAEQLRALMGAVVTEGGAKILKDVPPPAVLAKSGTAEYGTEQPLKSHAWMIAIHGDLAVAVFVETGEYGSTTAGPILKQFLTGLAAA